MPTYRITDRETGRVLSPTTQADSEFSAAAEFDIDAVTITQISPNPPAVVYTSVFEVNTPQGLQIAESSSTGSRQTALTMMAKEPPGRTLLEESPEINRSESRKRRK